MLSKLLIERIFTTANMRRWSDLATVVNFYELDKQSLKAYIAYILAKYEEQKGSSINWTLLIEGLIFTFFQRAILTDIKPQVYHKLLSQKPNELNQFFLASIKEELNNKTIYKKCESYFLTPTEGLEQDIIKASHLLSTKWEFDYILANTKEIYIQENIQEDIDKNLQKYLYLDGVKSILLDTKLKNFVQIISTLRFQTRWNNLPRIPKTSVLGHTYIVAILTYIFGTKLKYCDKMIYNNFFGGLFHDLAEALTRDIISPIKYSIDGLDAILKEYEKELVEQKILPLIPQFFHQEISTFVLDEFCNRVNFEIITDDIINYNNNSHNPKDGKLLKVCDHLSAYFEASISIDYGVSSKELKEAKKKLTNKYKSYKYNGINIEKMFMSF